MDPVTQTLLGTIAAQAALSGRLGRAAALIGAAGGALPDIDVLMTRLSDPALPWEYHRHFTHALAFIPIGAAAAAAPFMLSRSLRAKAGLVYAAALLGYATHGLLDACTAFGTHLLWPFTSARTSWDFIAIIDPIFTLALLIGVACAMVRGSSGEPGRPRPRSGPDARRVRTTGNRAAIIGLACAMLYMGFGAVQHQRGLRVQQWLAHERGHESIRGRVMPSIGNLIIWRSMYEHEGVLYADAIRLLPFGPAGVERGTSMPRFVPDELDADSPQRVRRVVNWFEFFADGYVAAASTHPLTLGDMRYSLNLAGFEPLWGVRIEPGNPHPAHADVTWTGFGGNREAAIAGLWRDIVDGEGFAKIQ